MKSFRHYVTRKTAGCAEILLPILMLLLLAYIAGLRLSEVVFPYSYSDEYYYITAGINYVKYGNIDLINWEHPPLAKYLIGLSTIYLGNPHVIVFLVGYLCVIIFFFTVLTLTHNYYRALFSSLLLCSSIPFIKTFNYALLDCFALFFSSLAFYLAILTLNREHAYTYSFVEGILWGLAVASKWTSLYLFLGRIICSLFRPTIKISYKKYFIILFVMSSITYMLAFISDLNKSFSVFLQHNIRMILFMLSHHSITLHTLTKGLTLLFLKTTFWHRLPNVFITLTVVNSTVINQSITITPAPYTLEIDILPTFGAFLLPLVPFALVYGILQFKKLSTPHKYAFILAVSSIFPVLHGSIPWYYIYATYFWCAFFATMFRSKYLIILLIMNILYYALLTSLNLNRLVIFGV